MADYFEEYEKMSDEDLVELSSGGDKGATECLLARYKNLVRSKARMYFLAGADKEDIIQEGMIGLFKAIRDFDRERLASFHGFAELCVKRQILTAVKMASRQKHKPLNSYISLDMPVYDEETEAVLGEIVKGSLQHNPEQMLIQKEKAEFLGGKIEEILSDMERRVLALYMDGKSYQEISEILEKPTKSVDNALQRVKKKMEKFSND